MNGLEIERKYLIRMPDEAFLRSLDGCQVWKIRQEYLADGKGRLRQIETEGKTVYILTEKKRISDVVREEVERELTKEEFDSLKKLVDPAFRSISKIRYRIPVGELLAEVDIFSFWQDRAVVEFELAREDIHPALPPWLTLIREVTDDLRYTNKNLARSVPMDEF